MKLATSRTGASLCCLAAPTVCTRAGSRLCRAGAHKFPGFLGTIISSGGKGKDKHTGRGHGHGHGQKDDEPSGMWRHPGHHWHDDATAGGGGEAAGHVVDGPAADYLALHPPPLEDDLFHPQLPPGVGAAAAAALLGPDMHGSLDPMAAGHMRSGGGGGGGGGVGGRAASTRFVISGGGAGASGGGGGGGGGDAAARHAAMMAQLRERALGGSSDEDESWRRMDIPGLLLSPYHAAAMRSLSSASDSEDGLDGGGGGGGGSSRGAWGELLAPDFADMTLAREADAAGAAAAEQVPPELPHLRHLARAASILGVHGAAGRGPAAGLGLGPRGGEAGAGMGVDDWGWAASGDASGSEAADWMLEANRFAGMPEEPLTPQQLEAAAALLLGNISPAAGLHASWCAGGGVSTGSDAEGERGAAPATAAAAAAATAGDAALIGGITVAQASKQPRSNKSCSSSGSSSSSSARAAAVAAVLEEGIEWLAGPAVAAPAAAKSGSINGTSSVSIEESRSVQLRRSAGHMAADGAAGLDAATRRRVAAAIADEVADAHAHVVRGHSAAAAAAAADPGGSSTSLVEEGWQQQQQRYSLTRGVAGAAGQLAADAAAADVAAEARRAVWGDGGWPYDAAVRSTDVLEELKHEIQAQQEAAQHGGGAAGGAAAGAPLGLP